MKKVILFFALALIIMACNNNKDTLLNKSAAAESEHEHEDEQKEVHLSLSEFNNLGLQIGSLEKRPLQNLVHAVGELTVPPQNKATVTALVGANISSIKVIEGDSVQKGRVLAYLNHPNLLRLQSDYVEAWHNAQYLEEEYLRQKNLLENKVGSGRDFKRSASNFEAAKALSKSLAGELKMLNLNPRSVREGNLVELVPLKAPISGFVQKVLVNNGQYVQPQTELFEILDIHHLHVDLMVFERDITKVKVNQMVRVRLRSLPDSLYTARIFAVGKNLEKTANAVHIHAELTGHPHQLLAGMYASGSIITDTTKSYSLPAEALVQSNDGFVVFTAEKAGDEYHFSPVTVKAGDEVDGFRPLITGVEQLAGKSLVLNKAYYLFSEMEGGEGHHH
jgi:cobalt-zinc-cadmium efflux system membrane fusion protein